MPLETAWRSFRSRTPEGQPAPMKRGRGIGHKAATISLMMIVAFNCYAIYLFPVHNWDMVAYIATALSYFNNDVDALHALTYEAVKAEVDPTKFDRLISEIFPGPPADSGYRREMFDNARSFYDQIPFYSVKPLYPFLIAILIKIGSAPVLATTLIPLAFYAACGAVVVNWVMGLHHWTVGFALSALLLFEPHILLIARSSTPDMLSAFLLVSGVHLLVNGKKIGAALAVFVVAVLARPDNLLFGFCLLAVMLPTRTLTVKAGVLFFGCLLSVYLLVTNIAGNYGWQTHFYLSNVDRIFHPVGFISPLGLYDYLKIYAEHAARLARSDDVALFVFLAVLVAYVHVRAEGWRSHGTCVCIAVPLYMGSVIAAFPRESDRVLAGAYLMVLLLAARAGALFVDSTDAGRRGGPLLPRAGGPSFR